VGLGPTRIVAGVGNQWHFDPDTYLAMVRSEIAAYDELQGALAEATREIDAHRVLDLGTGTGVTAARVLAVHPDATMVGVDSSADMLRHARDLLPEADLRVADLMDPLPTGPFELVVSAFAIHHLDAAGKAELFGRVAAVLAPGGRFALLDVVVPATAPEQPVPLEEGVDQPSTVADQLDWLAAAGLVANVVVARDDLAILAADRPG
jgi:tRNA (cmo5U34)-methyltransferase